ncbi:hypothetical protein EII30_08415 [Leucobacter sp. OH1287]|nr:hypothetical protein EII30_08415 [Leucobacter sp. OH1287]
MSILVPEDILLLIVVLLLIVIALAILIFPHLIIKILGSKEGNLPDLYRRFSPACRAATILHKKASYERDCDQKELQRLEEAARQEAARQEAARQEAARQEAARQNRGSGGKRKWLRRNRTRA